MVQHILDNSCCGDYHRVWVFGNRLEQQEMTISNISSPSSARLQQEVNATFQAIWPGSYRESNPVDPLADSTYYHFGYVSVMHMLYLRCIKPYITHQTKVLEIGCGGGAWTKMMLDAEEIWCLDARTAEANGIFEYLGHPKNVRYVQVSNAECEKLEDDKFDLVFSMGCLCHLPFQTVADYIRNLYPKMKRGSNGFIQIADYDKYNAMWDKRDQYSVLYRLGDSRLGGRRYFAVKLLLKAAGRIARAMDTISPPSWSRYDPNESDQPRPARWYHAGIGPTCAVLEETGFRVVCRDMEIIHRDPVIHFTKE